MYNYIKSKQTSLTKIISIYFCALVFSIVYCSCSYAATYYVCGNGTACGSGWSTGNNNNAGTSKASPCLTIRGGIAKMSSGDTLLIGDGTYVLDPLQGIPSGTAGTYTVVKADHTGGAILDMSSGGDWNHPVSIGDSSHHIQIEGFKIKGSLTANVNGVIYCTGDYIKFRRIAVYNGKQTDNTAIFVIGTNADHCLVEECWAWGTGRYKFIAYHATNTIFRRCVARHDYHGGNDGWSHQEAGFTNYDSTNTLFQNCIVIDSGVAGNTAESIYGGFWDENNINVSKTGKITGSIVLNVRTNQAGLLDKLSGTRTISDTVIWDSGGGYGVVGGGGGSGTYGATAYLSNMTIGSILYTYPGTYNSFGVATGNPSSAATVSTTNSILYNAHSYGASGYMSSAYNALYSNGTNYGNGATGGTGDRITTNPLTSGLLYLPRIEAGSTLKTAGSGGSQIGAQIIYKYGVDGTLYGETGYDTLTTDPLWPFPNEALIKSDMASYSGPGPSGARGFCAGTSMDGSPQSLTKYIWEYLGHQIPADIYGTTPLNGVCGTNNGGSLSSLTSGDANNCSSGTVANFTGTGPWTWYCAGSNGGTSSGTCSASLAVGDTTPPSVTISTATPQSISTDSLTVSGSASDTVGVTSCKYRIGAAPNASSGTACTGTTSWSCSASGYSSGPNTLYVGCTDAAGNWPASPPSITVNFTPATSPTCTYYVRPDGHDAASGANNTSNSSTGAWLTLQHASNTVAPGNTVCVADGTYAGFYVETSGTSSAPITFRALGTGANITSRNSRTADGINIESWTGSPASYITIDGYNVYNQTRMGIRAVNGTGIVIQNCRVHNNTNTGILSGNTPSIQVLNNTVYVNGSNGQQHNIYVSNALSDNPIIRGNTVYSAGGGNGIQLNGDYASGGDGYIDNAIVEENIVYSNYQKGLSLISIRYGRIQNNIIYNNGTSAGGIHLVEQGSPYYSINNVVVNNTIDEPSIATVRINANNTGNVVFNNVSLGPTGIVFEGSGNYQSNNSTSTTGFINRAGHDYHLVGGSPAIDSGLATYMSVTPPSVDFTGAARPQGAGYDIGAFEKIVPTGYIIPAGLDFGLISPENL